MRIRDTVVTAAGTAALITMLAGCGSAAPAPPSAAESASMPSAGSPTPSASLSRPLHSVRTFCESSVSI